MLTLINAAFNLVLVFLFVFTIYTYDKMVNPQNIYNTAYQQYNQAISSLKSNKLEDAYILLKKSYNNFYTYTRSNYYNPLLKSEAEKFLESIENIIYNFHSYIVTYNSINSKLF